MLYIMNEASGETPNSSGETGAGIKNNAIKRHHDAATSPIASGEEKDRARHALRILGRDRGKDIIINPLDEMGRLTDETIKNVSGENIIKKKDHQV